MISSKIAIKLEGVSTVYEGERRPAIRDINLTVEKNELVYVLGPNASGKTTLLETINGLLPIFHGKISVFGLDITTQGRRARCEIGYVPQDFMVEPGEPYTAFDVVMMGRYSKIGVLNKPDKRDHEQVAETMKLLEIENLARRPMGKLSGGQQQKVMIARALAKEPKILLFDEPFSNLDPESRENIPLLINTFHKEKEMTTLIVTHDLQGMLENCGRVVVINNGRVMVNDTPDKALEQWRSLS
ncbi:MAG: transporter protein [Thermoproteota archaeon]|nr:transporter protein [Thermoproteota archaeon]